MNLTPGSNEHKPTQTSNGARKKVLFVVTKSNFGGAQRYVFDLAKNLPRDRFHAVVACGPALHGKPGTLSHLLDTHGIPTIELPALRRDMGFTQDMRAFFALVGLLRAEKPDVVHLNSSKAGGLGALAARLAAIPRIVFTVHGLPSDEDRSPFARALIALATWATIMLSHHTIALSSDAFVRLRRLPFSFRKVTLIHNGIQPPEFESRADALASLRSIDPSIPDSFVGTIAELHPNKDVRLAIETITHLPDTHLVIIGDGDERKALGTYVRTHGVEARVHFLGYIQDAAKYLRAFDMFLLTSRKEGLPYVLLEAAAAHIPLVATDIPGVRDIVLPDFTGLLAKRDAYEIAAALRRLEDGALARSLTDEMATRLQKTFSFSQMLEKTAALYARYY